MFFKKTNEQTKMAAKKRFAGIQTRNKNVKKLKILSDKYFYFI